MARVTIRRTPPAPKAPDIEIARLRDLDVRELKAQWRNVFRREAPSYVPRHLLFRTLAYRLQADALGDLDEGSKRLLDRVASVGGHQSKKLDLNPITTNIKQGTILTREWKDRLHKVAVSADGFAWNGKTYPSLSKVAFEITGTRWNGPRFFGLRDNRDSASGPGS